VAVVIGSGSVKCAAAIGLKNVLDREGIRVDRVVGCSGGSIYAATFALGWDAARTREATLRLWTREATNLKNRRSLLSVIFPRLFGFSEQFGMRSDRLVMKGLREAFGDTRIEDTKIPLHLTATDFRTGEQVVLTSGSLVEAIRASIGIPFIFPPVPVGDQLLVDGFLSDPLPVGVAIREGADVILAMGFEAPYQAKINTLGRYAFQYSSIMSNNLLKSNFAFHNLAHHAEIIPMIPRFSERIRLFDTDKIPYIIAEGERTAEQELPYLKRLLAQPAEEACSSQ
jgi:NTE family protein